MNPFISKSSTLFDKLCRVLDILRTGLALWCSVGLASLLYLAAQVPLSAEDLRDAVWLAHPQALGAFAQGGGLFALSVALFIQQFITLFTVGTLRGLLITLILLIELNISQSTASLMRIGMLEGVVTIGCVEAPSTNCPAMSEKMALAPAATAHHPPNSAASYTSLPGWALLRAPLHWNDGARLARLIQAQRQQLQLRQASAHR